jgi:hypothetical protein
MVDSLIEGAGSFAAAAPPVNEGVAENPEGSLRIG